MSSNRNSYYGNSYYAVVLCIFASHIASSLCYSSVRMLVKHEKWMAEHGFSYENEKLKEERFMIFKKNMEHIERHNNEGNHTYKLGINKFADLTNEEFLAKYAGNSVPLYEISSSNQSSFNVKDVPPSLDWRDHNAVTPVLSQEQCGNCWIFSAVAAIEGIVAIKSGKLIPLSKQHILDCNYEHEGCEGGYMEHAFEFVMKNGGLASDTDYPYTATQGACDNTKPSSLLSKITGFGFVPKNDEATLLAAVANQPISVSIDPKLMQFYRSGVYTGECGINVNHAVTVVGYGQGEDGVQFWLLKNSWGTQWGEDGYFRMQRNVDAKEGMCGITLYATYPIA